MENNEAYELQFDLHAALNATNEFAARRYALPEVLAPSIHLAQQYKAEGDTSQLDALGPYQQVTLLSHALHGVINSEPGSRERVLRNLFIVLTALWHHLPDDAGGKLAMEEFIANHDEIKSYALSTALPFGTLTRQ